MSRTHHTYIIEEDSLLELLQRAHEGEQPFLVLAEWYAQSRPVEPDCD